MGWCWHKGGRAGGNCLEFRKVGQVVGVEEGLPDRSVACGVEHFLAPRIHPPSSWPPLTRAAKRSPSEQKRRRSEEMD